MNVVCLKTEKKFHESAKCYHETFISIIHVNCEVESKTVLPNRYTAWKCLIKLHNSTFSLNSEALMKVNKKVFSLNLEKPQDVISPGKTRHIRKKLPATLKRKK